MALKADGTLWAWGCNSNGQLGIGNLINQSAPVHIKLPNIIAIAAGSAHSLAVGTDGTVWTWGASLTSNQIQQVPIQVKGPNGQGLLSDIISITAGHYTTYALAANGTIWAWGTTNYGQMGNGTWGNTITSFPVHALNSDGKEMNDFIAVDAGLLFTFAMKSDGTMWAWGWNGWFSQFGNGISPLSQQGLNAGDAGGYLFPVKIDSTGLTSRTALAAAGTNHSLWNYWGTVYAWGRNNQGQLGDGTYTDNNDLVQVSSKILWSKFFISGVKALAAGGAHSLALTSGGQVYTWGSNNHGQLGTSNQIQNSTLASKVKGANGQDTLSSVTAIAAATGGDHNLALKADGTVWSWGNNSKGQLGNGNTTDQYTPVQVGGVNSQAIAVAAGGSHSLILKANGTVWACGDNYYGQLGNGQNGSGAEQHVPVQVAELNSVVAIAAGAQHSLALKADGTLWAWGNNHWGQLGNAGNIDSNIPIQVTMPIYPWKITIPLTGIKAIAGGACPTSVVSSPGEGAAAILGANSVALTASGKVLTWGNNDKGQLGIGIKGNAQNTPIMAKNISGIRSINNVSYHSIICNDQGYGLAVGDNTYGQLLNGTFGGDNPLYLMILN